MSSTVLTGLALNLFGRAYNPTRPLVYEDGMSILRMVEWLQKWINEFLVDHLNTEITELIEAIDAYKIELQAEMMLLEGRVNDRLEENEATVDARLDENETAVAAAIAEVISSSINLQDPVMSGILGNTNSATRIFLDALLDANTTLKETSQYRLDTLPVAVKEFVSINERTYQRSAVSPGPEAGDYYTVYFDRFHNPVISLYKSDERAFDTFNLSLVTNAPLRRTINDGHNSLSVFRDNLGFLYVAGNLHGNQLVILRSRFADNIKEWFPLDLSGLNADTASYPAFVALNDGSCLIQWRNGGASENGTWYFARMIEGGVIGAPVAAFTGASESAYMNQVQVDANGRIHVFYMWRTGFNNHFGYVYTDNNFGSAHTISGANVPLPITVANINPYIITGPHNYINQGGAAIDPVTNYPHAVLRTSAGDYRIDHVYWNGDTWITETVHQGVGNGVGRPGAFATADGRIYTAYRQNNRIAARRIWPTVGEQQIIVPYTVGGPEAGWELAFDEKYLKSDDRLRFFVQPVSSDAANTANNTMKEGTWGGVWSMSTLESAINSAGKKSGIASPATPMSPVTSIVQLRNVEQGNILKNGVGNRWIVPSGPRGLSTALVIGRVYATLHDFEFSGIIDALGLRVENAGVGATVKGYIFTERGATGPGRPIVAETAETPVTVGALNLPLIAPLAVRPNREGLEVNQYFIGVRFSGYTTVPSIVTNTIPDRSIQMSALTEAVNAVTSAYVTTAVVADGATVINSMSGAYNAPLIAVHTANW